MPAKLRLQIVASLRPGSPQGELLVKADGAVMNGNTRLYVLIERGIDVESLPRTAYPLTGGSPTG